MYILSRVCAEFRDKKGETIHTIEPKNLKLFYDAPEEIKDDPLFDMLVADGSILLATGDKKEMSNIEQDPDKGTTADGKKIVEEAGAGSEVEAEKKTEKAAKTSKSKKAQE